MRAFIIGLSLFAVTSALAQITVTPTPPNILKFDDLQASDSILKFQLVPVGHDTIETVLTLYADGRIEYGPAWSPENFYRAVCMNRRFGDCI